MLTQIGRFITTLVRPTLTWGMAVAFIYACFVNREAAQLLAGPSGIMVGFWFQERGTKPSS